MRDDRMTKSDGRTSEPRLAAGAALGVLALMALQAVLPDAAFAFGGSGGEEENLAFYVIGGIVAIAIGCFVGGPGLIKDILAWWRRIR